MPVLSDSLYSMPRKVTFTIRAIDELFRQLRYVPPETRRRQMDAAEKLIDEIEPERNYPQSFIIYRITGYRPESITDESTLVGEALVPDLASFVLRLSERLSLPAHGDGRTALTMDEVAAKLNVAPKSVQRYRRKGLVVHSVIYPDGSRKLGCFADALERFVCRHERLINRAASFTRVDGEIEQHIVAEARELSRESRRSLSTVARRLAEKHGRAHETVRQILIRHDRESDQPIFAEHGPLSDRDGRLINRAWRRGVSVSVLAARFGRTSPTIHRMINRQRAAKLRHFDLHYVTLPTFSLDDAASVLLSARMVNEGLDRVLPMRDAMKLLEGIEHSRALNENDETSLIAGYNFLKKRAADGLAGLPEWPGARALDEIETALRWATLLKRRLVSAGLPAAVGMIEQHVGRRLTQQPAEEIRAHIALAVRTVSTVIEALDPGKSQRLDRLSRYAIAREMAKNAVSGTPHRAIARHTVGDIALKPLFAELTPWSELLELPKRLADHLTQLTNPGREIVTRHYGLDGRLPQTCAAIAISLKITDTAVRRQLRTALAQLRLFAREELPERSRT